ncbi:MAG: hypothetical protein LQ350_005997 [Teloschistes chrysophthalmus]|nr:MAG: hypothetical protein LQ350_005997 [Niorma chrysophthalma]
MPDDDIELGQSPPDKKLDHPFLDSSEPESFYREARDAVHPKGMEVILHREQHLDHNCLAGEKDASSKETMDSPTTKPAIPPRTQKPRARRSTDDLDPRHLEKENASLRKDYEEIRRDLKSTWKENREQALELRDLKKQNTHLKESIRTQADPKSYKDQILNERRKFYEHVDMLDDHINHLKHQLDKTKLHMDQLTFQTREANEEKANYESKLQNLQKQNARLNEDLTECRDDILRLQPPSQIPDSKIVDEYANVYQQIASWVDDEAEDSSAMETQLENMLTDKDAPQLLKTCLDSDILRATRKHSDAEPLILRYVIQTHLHQRILADDLYLFGLDDHSITLLRTIAHSMEDLEPKRDALTIQRWRSETLQALAKIDGFQAEQQRQATTVSKDLWSALVYLLPEIASQETGWRRLHDTVVMPAVHLATNMRFSTSCYRIIPHLPRNAAGHNNVIYHPDIQRYTLLDVATQKVLRQDSVLKIAEDGRIGEHVMVIQPLLLRMQRDSNGGIALCKPTVAVRLDEPMARRAKGVKALAGWTSSWFGGEGDPSRT